MLKDLVSGHFSNVAPWTVNAKYDTARGESSRVIGLRVQSFRGAHRCSAHIGGVVLADETGESILIREGSGNNTDEFIPSLDRKILRNLETYLTSRGFQVKYEEKPSYLCPHENPPHPDESRISLASPCIA